jgi:hypothetical protein
MRVPEFAYGIANQLGKSDYLTEELWGQFVRARLNMIENQLFKEFFFYLMCKEGYGMVNRLINHIMDNIRIPRTSPVIEFKHEYFIYYLNMISEDKAKLLLIWALVQVCEELKTIKELANLLWQKKDLTIQRRASVINFI